MDTTLNELFEAQLQLQLESFGGVDPRDHDEEERARFIMWNAYALEDEIHEATGEVGWKPWATSRHLNREAYLGEMADSLHFFINLCLVAGITGEELAEAYFAKRKVNAQRQEDGYDGVTGKGADGRALDEPHVGPLVPCYLCNGTGMNWRHADDPLRRYQSPCGLCRGSGKILA